MMSVHEPSSQRTRTAANSDTTNKANETVRSLRLIVAPEGRGRVRSCHGQLRRVHAQSIGRSWSTAQSQTSMMSRSVYRALGGRYRARGSASSTSIKGTKSSRSMMASFATEPSWTQLLAGASAYRHGAKGPPGRGSLWSVILLAVVA